MFDVDKNYRVAKLIDHPKDLIIELLSTKVDHSLQKSRKVVIINKKWLSQAKGIFLIPQQALVKISRFNFFS